MSEIELETAVAGCHAEHSILRTACVIGNGQPQDGLSLEIQVVSHTIPGSGSGLKSAAALPATSRRQS